MLSAAPTGLVAFLFTDVEGSTRRWERYGETMRSALRRHDEIVRSAVESNGGYVFKTIGDAFCAAFSSAGQAVAAAIAAQRALSREDFSGVDGLYVRMAIHVGESDERDGDYFGTAPNRVARLLSAAHGGQVLLSGPAADLALPQLPPQITLRHLGSLELRDVPQPERVYQVAGDGLRSEFKPLRALETPPNNLPRQTTSFVGRHDDLARVEALLEEGPLVTVVGAGGIGKTRLALELAAGRLHDYRDGVWFVDLSSIVNAALIAATILSAIGGERSREGPALDDLLRHLEKRELLLVLDNSEHLVAEVAAIVAEIVARAAHVSILATSREPLDISAERLYRLSTLDAASAAQLFADRARAADSAFRLEHSRPVVEEICRRLDGIALAIELAAARVRTMPVESLLQHLELRLLAGGRDRRPRQQTMRALVGWSYDLLQDADRAVLRRCSVFLAGFTLRTAAVVCDRSESEAFERLASLVDKSLVVGESDASARYRILEPIREYAFEQLQLAGDLADARRRHAHAFASLAHDAYEEWDRGPGADWLARLEKDLSNFRMAVRWSLDEGGDAALGAQIVAAVTPLFMRLGLAADGVEYCRRVLEAQLSLPPALEGRLRYGLSMLYSNLGQNQKCLEQATIAVECYGEAGDVRGLSRALSQAASRQAFQGRLAEARAAADRALSLARSSGDRRLLADVLRRCAEAFSADGDDCVRAAYAESVALFRSLGSDDDTARALTWWGQWESNRGDFGAAVERLLEAARLGGDGAMVMYHSVDVASCYLALGDRARAEPFAREALAAAIKTRYELGTYLAIAYLAAVATERDPTRAGRLLGYAEARLREQEWQYDAHDAATLSGVRQALERELGSAGLASALAEGAALTKDQAVALL